MNNKEYLEPRMSVVRGSLRAGLLAGSNRVYSTGGTIEEIDDGETELY